MKCSFCKYDAQDNKWCTSCRSDFYTCILHSFCSICPECSKKSDEVLENEKEKYRKKVNQIDRTQSPNTNKRRKIIESDNLPINSGINTNLNQANTFNSMEQTTSTSLQHGSTTPTITTSTFIEDLDRSLTFLLGASRDTIDFLQTENAKDYRSLSKQLCKNGIGLSDNNTFNTLKKIEPVPELGVITWNINKQGEEKGTIKKDIIIKFFSDHKWLDVLALQELFGTGLETLLSEEAQEEFAKQNCSIYPGPALKIRVNKSKKEETFPRKEYHLEPGERYALIIRNDPRIKYLGWSIFSDQGWHTQAEIEQIADDTSWIKTISLQKTDEIQYALYWSKQKKFYSTNQALHFRPFVVHNLQVDGKEVFIGIVHTSPDGAGLFRKGVYNEIKDFLEAVKKKALEKPESYWILPGDYYLDPISSTRTSSKPNTFGLTADNETIEKELAKKRDKMEEGELIKEPFEDKVKKANLKFAIAVSATNQSSVTEDVTEAIYLRPKYFERDYALKSGFKDGLFYTKYVNNSRADFFLCTLNYTLTHAGLINPRGKNFLPVDPNHHAINWWSAISDHVPIGAVFCNSKDSQKYKLVTQDILVIEQIDRIKFQLEEIYYEALASLADTVDEIAHAICSFPTRPEQILEVKVGFAFDQIDFKNPTDFARLSELLYLFILSILMYAEGERAKTIKFPFHTKLITNIIKSSVIPVERCSLYLTKFLLFCNELKKHDDDGRGIVCHCVQNSILPALKALGYRIEDFETAWEDDEYEDVKTSF